MSLPACLIVAVGTLPGLCGAPAEGAGLTFTFRGTKRFDMRCFPGPNSVPHLIALTGEVPPQAASTLELCSTETPTCRAASAGPCRILYFTQRVKQWRVWGAGAVCCIRTFPGAVSVLCSWTVIDPSAAQRPKPLPQCPPGGVSEGKSAPRYVLLPSGGELIPVSVTERCSSRPWENHFTFADVRTGAVLRVEPKWYHASGWIEAFGTPGTRPDGPQNPPRPFPLQELDLRFEGGAGTPAGGAITDQAGFFAFAAQPDALSLVINGLKGPFVSVKDLSGETLLYRSLVDPPRRHTLNRPPEPAGTAQVNAFRHFGIARAFVREYDPDNPVLGHHFLIRVNVPDLSCNGAYGGRVLEFGAASEQCANAAYSTVVHHEFAHAVLQEIYRGKPGPTTALAEGLADAFTVLLNGNPHVAEGLRGPGPGRNAAELFRWPDDVDREDHVAGLIVAGAWWDLRTELEAELGHTGVEYTCRLFFQSLHLTPRRIDPGLGMSVLFLDDDDGDPSNATPHFPAIIKSFGRHGLLSPSLYGTVLLPENPRHLSEGARPSIRVRVLGPLQGRLTVWYQLNEDPLRHFYLSAQPLGYFVGRFPKLDRSGVVSYYVEGRDAAGNAVFSPAGAPFGERHCFTVGRLRVLLSEDFESGASLWRSGTWNGLNEWQIGSLSAAGGPWDPPEAYQGSFVAGQDLGGPGRDGNYRRGSYTFLESPLFTVPEAQRVVLRFARYLTVAAGDEATVELGDQIVWSSQGRLVLDTAWRMVVLDVTPLLEGRREASVRFVLRAAEDSMSAGGWHLDAVSVEAVGAGSSFTRGDADLSGRVDIVDALTMARGLLGAGPLQCQDAADVNDDGSLTLSDAFQLLRYLFAGGPPPAPPFPEAGEDESPDELSCNSTPFFAR